MPTLHDFIDQLRAAGVHIKGEDQIIQLADLEPTEWSSKVAELFRSGRKNGVTFTRTDENTPSDEILQSIVRGYPFSEGDQRSIASNIIPLKDDVERVVSSTK